MERSSWGVVSLTATTNMLVKPSSQNCDIIGQLVFIKLFFLYRACTKIADAMAKIPLHFMVMC